jgi:hypothetical protein
MTKKMKLARRFAVHSFCTVLALGLAASCSGVRKTTGPTASFVGLASEEALVDQFVAAVSAQDKDAMNRLRVTAAEYRDVIIPGTAPVGKTMQGPLSEKKFNFWWSMLNTRSRDFAAVILHDFGGHNWQRQRYWYTDPPKEYSGYRALGEVRIAVVDEAGTLGTMRTGTIADVGGQYKFIGFEYDD